MPRTGENIYKRKDGRWEGRYIRERVDGKARYCAVYGKSYKEVKHKLEVAKCSLIKIGCPPLKIGKMEEVGQQWLEEVSVTLKKSSANKYEDMLRCYILPQFGEKELSEITNQDIIDFTNYLLAEGGSRKQGLKPTTVTEVLSALNGIRVYAVRQEYAVAYSTECIRLKQEKKEIRVFSRQEEDRLLEYLRENMELPELGILLCLFTGLRVGELCAMKWDDISLTEQKMYVRKTMQRVRVEPSEDGKTEVKLQEPKSASSVRTIPLPDAIIELLGKYSVPGTFLLTGQDSRYLEPRTMQNRFKKILMACGIPDANFHATRHTFATRCIELGFDVKSLSEILGHASVAITMNRYVHPTMDHKAAHMNRFSDLIDGTEGRS